MSLSGLATLISNVVCAAVGMVNKSNNNSQDGNISGDSN